MPDLGPHYDRWFQTVKGALAATGTARGQALAAEADGMLRPPGHRARSHHDEDEIVAAFLIRSGYHRDEVGSVVTQIPVAGPSGKPVMLPTAVAALVEEARAAGLSSRGATTGSSNVLGHSGVPRWAASLIEQLHRSKGAESDARQTANAYQPGTTDSIDDPVLNYLAAAGYR